MPVAEHTATYLGVMDLFKWAALGVADLLILLVLAFCTGMSLFPALVISASCWRWAFSRSAASRAN